MTKMGQEQLGVVSRACIARAACSDGAAVRTVHVGNLVHFYPKPHALNEILFRMAEDNCDPGWLHGRKQDILQVPPSLLEGLLSMMPNERVMVATLPEGSKVHVLSKSMEPLCPGTILLRTTVPGHLGVCFGVELQAGPERLDEIIRRATICDSSTFQRGVDAVVSFQQVQLPNSSLVQLQVENQLPRMPRSTSQPLSSTSDSLDNEPPNRLKKHVFRSFEHPPTATRVLTSRQCSSLDIPSYHRSSPELNQQNGDSYDENEADVWNDDFQCDDAELGVGSMVEVTQQGSTPQYGVLRWLGCANLQNNNNSKNPIVVAGVEMEEENERFTDGSFAGRRRFVCNPHRALFAPFQYLRKDSRFQQEQCFGQVECPAVEGTVPPITSQRDVVALCGKHRGIQGHHNSCYLDATLFAMFAFSYVFDAVLYRPWDRMRDIAHYDDVQRVLRDEIVNPLRRNLFVRADRVMRLRQLMDRLGNVSGLTSEEKDPEEFLQSLLAQILKADPFLKLSSGQEAFHYQLFVEKDERLVFPTVQELFEQSFLTSDVKLRRVPSCLIIQMPRFGKSFKMYPRILPSPELDVTDVIDNSPRECVVCGKLAEVECADCLINSNTSGRGGGGVGTSIGVAKLDGSSLCSLCVRRVHAHPSRASHRPRALAIPQEFRELQQLCANVPRLTMHLFAVLCIETSHYVAFVRSPHGWVFFDSMADRKGEQDGYNIPEVVPCPELPYWLSEEGSRALAEMHDERQLPEHAKRLFCDAYMCMYESPDIIMYM